MADSIVGGLFGMTPESYQAQQNQQALAQSEQLGQLDPFALARTGLIYGGRQIGGAIAGALGGGDPQLKLISQRNAVMKEVDLSNPSSLQSASQRLSQVGDIQGAMALNQQAVALNQQQLESQLTGAKYQKEVFSASQETKLRDELSKLGPDATQEQVLGIVTKYGSPDRVLAALQASSDRAAQRDNAMQMARERIDANIQMAKDRGATAMQIAQMQLEGRQQMAAITQSMQQQSLDLRQQAADEKKKAAEQQKLGVVASFDSALDTLDTISKHPGKSAAVGFGGAQLSMIPGTNAAGFAAQLETFKAQTFLPQVQALKGMGALSDAEGKKLTAAVGALSQSMKQSEFDAQVSKIKRDLEAARSRVGTSMQNAPSAPAPTTPVATKRWNPQTNQLEEIK
jgi:hypothetical protein